MQKNSLVVSVVYIFSNIFPPTDWSTEKCTRHFLHLKLHRKVKYKRIEFYSKTAIQAIKKGVLSLAALHKMARGKSWIHVAAKNGCDKKFKKCCYEVFLWQKKINNNTSGEFLLIPSEAGMRTQIDLNCCG